MMRLSSMFKTTGASKKALSAGISLRVVVCSFFILFCANSAQSKGIPFFLSWGTEICVVKELPDDCKLQTADNGVVHVNLGVVYDELSLFGIPLWNWNVEKYVFLPDNYDSLRDGNYVFYNIDASELRAVEQIVGELPEKPELSFWRSYGGKLIFLTFILFILYVAIAPSDKKE